MTAQRRNDAATHVDFSDVLRHELGRARAERLARVLIATMRRTDGLTATWGPGEHIYVDVDLVSDCYGGDWRRDPASDLWHMVGYLPDVHNPRAGEPHTDIQLLAEWGPVTAVEEQP